MTGRRPALITRSLFACTLLAACNSEELPVASGVTSLGSPEAPPEDPGEFEESGDETGVEDLPPTGESTGDEPVDCSAPPALPETFTYVDDVPWHEDFAFDDEGFMWGVSGVERALLRTTRQIESTVITTAVGGANPNAYVRGTRFLPDGDLVIADPGAGTLLRVSVDGEVRVLVSGLDDPNGIVVDAGGRVYLTEGSGTLSRIDPEAETVDVLATELGPLDGIALSPAEDALYVNELRGEIFELPLEAGGEVGELQPFAQVPIEVGGSLDGMTTDACGLLYVVEMRRGIHRFAPTGEYDGLVDLAENPHSPDFVIPAIQFGSGVGGWETESLYAMDFRGGLFVLDIGIAGAGR